MWMTRYSVDGRSAITVSAKEYLDSGVIFIAIVTFPVLLPVAWCVSKYWLGDTDIASVGAAYLFTFIGAMILFVAGLLIYGLVRLVIALCEGLVLLVRTISGAE